MKAFYSNLLSTVIAAAVIGNCTILFQFGERLARIEAKLEALTQTQNLANK